MVTVEEWPDNFVPRNLEPSGPLYRERAAPLRENKQRHSRARIFWMEYVAATWREYRLRITAACVAARQQRLVERGAEELHARITEDTSWPPGR